MIGAGVESFAFVLHLERCELLISFRAFLFTPINILTYTISDCPDINVCLESISKSVMLLIKERVGKRVFIATIM